MPRFEVRSLKAVLERQEWLKTADVAEYLGTSPNNIRNMIYRHHLSPRKFYGRWYFKKSDVDSLLGGNSWA